MSNVNKYDENLHSQIIKLIANFYYDKNIQSYVGYDNRDEFISVAYDYFLQRDFINKYDPNRSTIGTFVYYLMKQNWYIFVLQTQYNISYTQAKKLNTIDENKREKVSNIYTPLSLEDIKISKNNDEEDKHDSLDFISDNKPSVEEQVYFKIQYENAIKVLNDCQTLSKKHKEILKWYMNNNFNLRKTAEHFNCSRQHVNNILLRYRKILNIKGITARY